MKHSLRDRLWRTEFFQPWHHHHHHLVGAAEEGELLLEELVDLGEGELLAGHALDGHHDEGDVAVGRLLLPPHSWNDSDNVVTASQYRDVFTFVMAI